MEQYGRSVGGSQSDPSPEWTAPGPETGLEESMWQLGLGPGESYPERPDEADCSYYLRTGICGYGSRCRYNHPRDRSAVIGAVRAGAVEYPERVGQPVCQYYMRTGTCKFGATCKYHHPKQGGGSATPVSLNHYGYPLRPGERECSYYVKTGQCKFGATCKFHHPQLTGIQPQVPSHQAPIIPAPTLYQTVQSPSVTSQPYGALMVARPPLLPSSYVQSPYGPMLFPPGMIPVSGWSPYPASASPLPSPGTQTTVGSGTIYGINQLSPSASAYTGIYPTVPYSLGPPTTSQMEQPHPERPGQAECQYYLRTGDCKFGSSCRYHHPADGGAPKTPVALSSIGLPSRPGAPLCTHYAQHGACKFGSACKFDHPMGTLSYSPSASSLTDMPVAPYPVGSSIGTLAPSSSSSELPPEHNLGSSKDSISVRMSSSLSTVSGSVGSTVSQGGVTNSGGQQSAQGSSPSTTNDNTTDSRSSS